MTVYPPSGVGLVGAGGFGVFCLAAFAEMPEVKVTAVADTDLSRAQKSAPPGAKVYSDYRALLADPDVQIVAINTPPHLHASMAQQAAAAGKHIFVEKPLATALQDALAAVQAARQARVQITVDYVLRYHPLHRLAAALVHGEVFGLLQHFSLENFATDETLLPGHWFWDPARSGGIHIEHGVHFFDLCNHLAGTRPEAASGCSQQRADGRIDRVSAVVRYGNEVLATFYHSFTQIRAIEQTTIRVDCTRGHLTITGWIPTELSLAGITDNAGLNLLSHLLGEHLEIGQYFKGDEKTARHGGTIETIAAQVRARVKAPDRQGDYKRAIQAGLSSLVGAIRGDQALDVTVEEGLTSLAVAVAATESSAHGQTLAVPDTMI